MQAKDVNELFLSLLRHQLIGHRMKEHFYQEKHKLDQYNEAEGEAQPPQKFYHH